VFIEANDDGGGGDGGGGDDTTNIHSFYRPIALPVAQPTASKH